MDPSAYKQVVSARGIRYNYFASSPTGPSKHTLLFLNGFPSTSYDWRYQIPYFQQMDYPILAPDLLGYGGTDKPLDPEAFAHSKMARDIIDLLNAENVEKVIVISHDWGAVLASRLASYYPERFLGYAFLAVGYVPTFAGFEFQVATESITQAMGYNTYGYWEFLASQEAGNIIREHWDSFLNIVHTAEPGLWLEHVCRPGGLRVWILADKIAPPASYLTEKGKVLTQHLMGPEIGLTSALNWYEVMMQGITGEDDKNIPEGNKIITQPVFFGACNLDAICSPTLMKPELDKHCERLTVKNFDAGHWVQLEVADEVSSSLSEWLDSWL